MNSQPLQVGIGSPAWTQIGRLTENEYWELRKKLDELAAKLASAPQQSSPEPKEKGADTRAFFVGNYAMLYSVDAARGLLTLLEVTHRLPGEG